MIFLYECCALEKYKTNILQFHNSTNQIITLKTIRYSKKKSDITNGFTAITQGDQSNFIS